MKFPLKINDHARCLVCKAPLSAPRADAAQQPESVAFSFNVLSTVHGPSHPVFLGSLLQLGWDSGIRKSPRSQASIGTAFTVAKKDGRDASVGEIDLHCCSAHCLRQLLNGALDELERRISEQRPVVHQARKSRRSKDA
ncbi:MAG: hypothetical protein LBE21_06470 [Pseudomonadales bacterium]|jgi:hypothetical protein|nr:hypothetical protein [Pseudomonadales bacterium]